MGVLGDSRYLAMRWLSVVLSVVLTILAFRSARAISKQTVLQNEKLRLLQGLKLTERPGSFGDAPVRWAREIGEPLGDEDGTETKVFAPKPGKGFCQPADAEPVGNCFVFRLEATGSTLNSQLVLDLKPELRNSNVTISIYDVSKWLGDYTKLEDMEIHSLVGTQVKIDLREETYYWFRRSPQHATERFIKIDVKVDGLPASFPEVFSSLPLFEIVFGKKYQRPAQPGCLPENPCCLTSFYVNFTEIGWSDWILSPAGYHANYCIGSCPYNQGKDENDDQADLKAILRSSRSEVPGFFLPEPRCAPLYYAPLTLMYATGPRDFRRTTIHGMRAVACSCFSH